MRICGSVWSICLEDKIIGRFSKKNGGHVLPFPVKVMSGNELCLCLVSCVCVLCSVLC